MHEYRKLLETILSKLLTIPTAPFRQDGVLGFIKSYAEGLGFAYDQDDMGNIIVSVGGNVDSTLAIEAHTDHPGFIIAENSDGPRVNAMFYGFVEEEYFAGTAVNVYTNAGIVGGRVVSTDFTHKDDQIKKVVLQIDGPVSRGDLATWALDDYRFDGDLVHSRAIDDLGGCAAILAVMKLAADQNESKSFKAIFTVAEESGLNGAKYIASCGRLSKEMNIITVETSSLLAGAPAGDGAVIRVGDRMNVFDNGLLKYMECCAKKIKKEKDEFLYQRKLMDGGTCESSIYQKFGYRTAAMCVPLGNYHNRDVDNKRIAQEYINLNDLAGLVMLFEKMLEKSDEIEKHTNHTKHSITEEVRDLGERIIHINNAEKHP